MKGEGSRLITKIIIKRDRQVQDNGDRLYIWRLLPPVLLHWITPSKIEQSRFRNLLGKMVFREKLPIWFFMFFLFKSRQVRSRIATFFWFRGSRLLSYFFERHLLKIWERGEVSESRAKVKKSNKGEHKRPWVEDARIRFWWALTLESLLFPLNVPLRIFGSVRLKVKGKIKSHEL